MPLGQGNYKIVRKKSICNAYLGIGCAQSKPLRAELGTGFQLELVGGLIFRSSLLAGKLASVIDADLAEHFGVSRRALSTLLNGKASLSVDMAIRFEKAFGVTADEWRCAQNGC